MKDIPEWAWAFAGVVMVILASEVSPRLGGGLLLLITAVSLVQARTKGLI